MTPTQETFTSSGRMLRRSVNDQHDDSLSFWIDRPMTTFIAIHLIMVIGVGCILLFEMRSSEDTSTTTVESRPAQLVSTTPRPLIDSLPSRETLPSGHQ